MEVFNDKSLLDFSYGDLSISCFEQFLCVDTNVVPITLLTKHRLTELSSPHLGGKMSSSLHRYKPRDTEIFQGLIHTLWALVGIFSLISVVVDHVLINLPEGTAVMTQSNCSPSI